MRHALVAAVALVAFAAAVPSPAGAATGCGAERDAIAGVRGAVRVAGGSCDVVVSCSAAGGCQYTVVIEATGTGLVEAEIDGPFGVLRCGPAVGACRSEGLAFLSNGVTGVAECTATGLAVDVSFSCSIA